MYPKFVDKNNIEKIEDVQNGRLFKLSIPLNFKGEKRLLVISRGVKPFEFDGYNKMVLRILNYIKHKKNEELIGVSRVDIVFLFPVMEYECSSLENILYEYGEKYLIGNDGFYDEKGNLIKNDEVIFESMMSANYLILAWGDMPSELCQLSKERIKYLLKGYKIIKNNSIDVKESYTVGALTNNCCPKHCLAWKNTDELFEIEL